MELETRFKLSDSVKGPKRDEADRLSRTYWFDPSRGYALLAYREAYDGESPYIQRIIDELTEAAPGVFFPARARIIRCTRNPTTHEMKVVLRGEFRAAKIIANHPLDPAHFPLTPRQNPPPPPPHPPRHPEIPGPFRTFPPPNRSQIVPRMYRKCPATHPKRTLPCTKPALNPPSTHRDPTATDPITHDFQPAPAHRTMFSACEESAAPGTPPLSNSRAHPE